MGVKQQDMCQGIHQGSKKRKVRRLLIDVGCSGELKPFIEAENRVEGGSGKGNVTSWFQRGDA